MIKKAIEYDLLPFMEKVLNENNIKYEINKDLKEDKEFYFLMSEISDNDYESFEEHALCLQQQGDSRVPVIPFHIFADEEKRKEIVPGGSCRILKRDEEKFRKYLETR